MEHAFLHKLGRALWRGLLIAVVLLAAYVSLGRVLVAAVDDFQQAIVSRLNEHLPFRLQARQVQGEWVSFNPELVLSGLRLELPGSSQSLELAEGRGRLDVMRSLLTGSLQFSRVTLGGLVLPLQVDHAGKVSLPGFDAGGETPTAWLRALTRNIEHLALENNRLQVSLPESGQRELSLELSLQREGSLRRLEGQLHEPGRPGRVDFMAQGLGDVFASDTLQLDAYLKASTLDLADLPNWLPGVELPVAGSGSLGLELWLNWDQGKPRMELRVDTRELQLEQGEWSLPAADLHFNAAIEKAANSWTVFASELVLQQESLRLDLPRVQLDIWGDSLRLRAEEVPLAPLSQLYGQLPGTPQRLVEALDVLSARGTLPRVEFSLDDLTAPGEAWQLEANFKDLAVQSWRGAPALTGGSGYVRLLPGEGSVVLDSREFTMLFPTVYDEALAYDEVYGTVHLQWDERALNLHSGLITAQGEEGTARALFGLEVPFYSRPGGITMDLMVGLRDSKASYRRKYLPRVLDERLLSWLEESLEAGDLAQGAFLWRGSLSLSAHQLRTVQLFFEVEDAELRYQPDWPPLSDLDGLVLIDDAKVSVWAQHARLYQSRLQDLSAEAWQDSGGAMQLAVSAHMQGPAADGLRLVRESPLNAMSEGVFAPWQADGKLDTSLELQLELGAAPEPRVAVEAVLSDTDVDIQPLALQLEGLAGTVSYSSEQGFDAEGLGASLWGEPVEFELGVLPGAGPRSLQLDFSGRAPALALQRWLGLPETDFAEGGAQVQGELSLGPDQPLLLSLHSDLQGFALNLPAPLDKQASGALPLSLELQLAAQPRSLTVQLGRRLGASVLLDSQLRVLGAELALQGLPAEATPGEICLSGHVASLSLQDWWAVLAPVVAASAEASERPNIHIDELLVSNLDPGSFAPTVSELRDLVLSVTEDGGWTLAAETDWVQGDLHLTRDFERAILNLSYLDLEGIPNNVAGDSTGAPPQLPELEVSIASLRDGNGELGQLDFSLRSDGELLEARNIRGQFAGFTLAADTPANLLWSSAEQLQTRLEMKLGAGDLGALLEQRGYERILESEAGQFDFSLEWPGTPQDFDLERLRGRLGLDISAGRFLNASAGTSGTLRVVSILNLAEIVQRLSLSHMFESGIPFDELKGEVFFHDGVVEVVGLKVEGASSRFTFTALSDLATRELDGELVATLPVASNLPWVAALTAGLPVAAGVFVVSKVFAQTMDRFSSAVYSIDGTWDEPVVKFSRIFSDGGSGESGGSGDSGDSGESGEHQLSAPESDEVP